MTRNGPSREHRSGPRPPWAHSERLVPRRVVRPLQEFLQASTSSGIVLIVAAAIALAWANSPFADSYERLWNTRLSVDLGASSIEGSLRMWVNEGLMALFFLVVGLEIKRELLTGELRDRRAAALPAIAAVGGMVLPALIYLALNPSEPAARGWGIAMPTDIAFTLGILALAVRDAPAGLKAFVLSLAIVDDLLTVVVIAVFYPSDIDVRPLLVAVAIGAAFFGFERIHVRAPLVYVALGVGMWLALHEAGVPPALAGVAVGFLAPAVPFQRPSDVSEEALRVADETVDEPDPPDADAPYWLRLAWLSKEAVSPLTRVEHLLLPWTSFVVLPLFALANAGIVLSVDSLSSAFDSPVTLALSVGRVLGKVLGIGLATWLALRFGAGRLSPGVRLDHVVGVAAAAGIAFTVSLFVAQLAFSNDAGLLSDAKIGILGSAIIAGPLGLYLLRRASRRDGDPAERPPAEAD